MFGYNYKMTLVNPEKGIVKLRPTAGTLTKAFLPSVVIGFVWVAVIASQKDSVVEEWNPRKNKFEKKD